MKKRTVTRGSKFQKGDKVYLTGRAPKSLRSRIQARARTIVTVEYNHEKQCCYYYLGDNGKSEPLPWFRCYMLRKEALGHKQKTARKYTRKTDKTPDSDLRTSQAPFERK